MRVQTFSTYQRMAHMGLVDPIVCYQQEHSQPMITALGSDGEPYLWCMSCDYILNPGINLYEKINRIISSIPLEEYELND